MTRTLLILGAGQYGSVAYEIANAMNCFEKIAFLRISWFAAERISPQSSFSCPFIVCFRPLFRPDASCSS